VVNNAGMIARKSAEEITEDDWDNVIDQSEGRVLLQPARGPRDDCRG
jgi:NADP-dependent 3-hydroxy acid dehydrogenase YdfG